VEKLNIEIVLQIYTLEDVQFFTAFFTFFLNPTHDLNFSDNIDAGSYM
jgi:hypothetical protein